YGFGAPFNEKRQQSTMVVLLPASLPAQDFAVGPGAGTISRAVDGKAGGNGPPRSSCNVVGVDSPVEQAGLVHGRHGLRRTLKRLLRVGSDDLQVAPRSQ